ncbi:MAG TPA: ACP S-malonyltransferase [Chloroflexota bacterium]|nr:ACP S-malonyltransferase [Chloroflexota bacterium]
MGKLAFVFPGQGAAVVGMGRDIVAASPAAAALWEQAVAALPALPRLCFEGPLAELVETVNAQPAIFAVDCACLAALTAEGIVPAVVAGHSLGEYAALVAAGALEFASALALVRARAAAMQAACARPGSMLAVTGLDAARVEALVAEWRGDGLLVVANYNCPGQVVVSGDVAAIRAAAPYFTAAGARVTELAVGGAFHSPLMAPGEARFLPALEAAPLRDARLPVVPNLTARPTTAAEELRAALRRQITGSVRWQQSVEAMLALGVDTFIEVGPGRTLLGLVRRTAAERGLRPRLLNVEDAASLARTVAALRTSVDEEVEAVK